MPIEWNEPGREYKAKDNVTYFWVLTCAKGCSHVRYSTTREADPAWAREHCVYDGTPLRWSGNG